MCVLLSDAKRQSCLPALSSLLLPLQHCETQSLQKVSCCKDKQDVIISELLVCGLIGRENRRKTGISTGSNDIESRIQTEFKLLNRYWTKPSLDFKISLIKALLDSLLMVTSPCVIFMQIFVYIVKLGIYF